MQKPRLYFSIDIEASGPDPSKHSLLSIGACVIGNRSEHFYREVRPLNREGSFNEEYDVDAMKIVCPGLRIGLPPKRIGQSEERYYLGVLCSLGKEGYEPKKAIEHLSRWVKTQKQSDEKAIFVADAFFDWGFLSQYNDFYGCFGHNGLHLGSQYQGLTGNPNANLRDLGIKDTRNPPHNALEDAIFQAQLAEEVFKLFGDRSPLIEDRNPT